MSFARYPAYKDSGVEWLGEVPAHWEVFALKWLVGLRSGEAITADSINEDGDYPVFGGNGLRGYTDTFTHDGRFALIGRQGALCGNVNYASGKFWASEHAVVATPRMPLETRWLGELLRVMNLGQHSVAAAQPGLAVEIIGSLRIPIPPAAEQTAIATFLDLETAKIDALVAEQERLIELLKEKRQAVISHAVTKGLDPSVPMKDSGVEWLGEVPTHWNVGRLASLFVARAEAGSGDLPVLSVSIHHGVSDAELDEGVLERKVTRSEDRSKYKRVHPDDLVYNMMRAWQGAFGAVTVDGQVSPAYVVAQPTSSLPTKFVEHLLRTPAAIEEMRRYSKGVTDFRLRLYWEEWKQIPIAIPPKTEAVHICEAIEAVSDHFDTLSAAAADMIALLQERRAALISAAVTGQIDVREAV